jgi:HEAT repeats
MANALFDIPGPLKRRCKRGSPALKSFYDIFFVNWTALSRREADLRFTGLLKGEELAIAKELIRRNLNRGYDHILDGAAVFRDTEVVPQLKKTLAAVADLSRRLTIAGTLWRIAKDPSFEECLREMVRSENHTLKEAHFEQIGWLGDERAIDMLIDLLSDRGDFVRSLAVAQLNEIEHQRRFFHCHDG